MTCFLRILEAYIHSRILYEIFFRLLISDEYILNMGGGRKIITVTLAIDAYYDIKKDTCTDLCMQKYKGLTCEPTFLHVTLRSSQRSSSFLQQHLCSVTHFPLGTTVNPCGPQNKTGRNAFYYTFVANF